MTLDADNARVAITGAVYTAPLESEVPTTPTEAWGEEWVDLGYVDENGVTESQNDQTAEIKAWQSGVTVRRLITGSTHNFAFGLLESKGAVLELYHKGSQVEDAGGGVARLLVVAPLADRRMFGFDMIDGDVHTRIIIRDGEVSERGDLQSVNSDVSKYPVTITAYPTTVDATDNVTAEKLSDDDAWLEEIGS